MLIKKKKISNFPSIKVVLPETVLYYKRLHWLHEKNKTISTINSTHIISKVMTRKKKMWSYITSTMDLKHNNYSSPGHYDNAVHVVLGSWNLPLSNCTNTCLQLCSGEILCLKPVVATKVNTAYPSHGTFYCKCKGEYGSFGKVEKMHLFSGFFQDYSLEQLLNVSERYQ